MEPIQQGSQPEADKLLKDLAAWLRRSSKLLIAGLAFSIIGFIGGPLVRNSFFWQLFFSGGRTSIKLSEPAHDAGSLRVARPPCAIPDASCAATVFLSALFSFWFGLVWFGFSDAKA